MNDKLKIEIDIDPEKANQRFSLRERVAIHILLVIFGMTFPAKYSHQVAKALEPITDLLNPHP